MGKAEVNFEKMSSKPEKQFKQVTQSNTNSRSGQYLTHAHSHITRAVTAMDSCFDLIRSHQQKIAMEQKIGLKTVYSLPIIAEVGTKYPFERQLLS